MKKTIKSFLFVLLMFLSLTLVACTGNGGGGGGTDTPTPGPDNPGGDNPTPDPVVNLVGLDIYDQSDNILGGQIVNYAVNEDIDTSIVKAFAHYVDNTTTDVTESVTIDASRYNKAVEGTYEIIVSYTEDNVTVKSFFLAAVGSGENPGGPGDGGEIEDVFGPGTYEFNAAIDLQDLIQNGAIAVGTKYAGGYFELQVPGEGAGSFKRANSSTFALELPKAEGGWIEFEVTGTATVTLVVSSTGGSNDSSIAIYDEESSLVQNNEGITIVSGTTQTTITYTLQTGTYRILSQAGTTNSNRGVRVYSVKVIQ